MAEFSTLLLNWFNQNKRNLPWRDTNDPYKIWLSEIILQQTRVDQGMNYYLKFIKNYPTVNDLAKASEDDVLNDWQGLGYYSRARNMHFSAKWIVEEHDGVFPTTFDGVKSLKGVGDYTAAAIVSIAYGLPHAVVDGNVYRVLSRYLGVDTPIDTGAGKKIFQKAANAFLDHTNSGDFNQAMMELGAMVCTPKNPTCNECPIENGCVSRKNGTQLDFPVKSKKTKVTKRYLNYLILTDGTSTIIKKRTGKGIWQGLYDFPVIEKKKQEEITEEELASFNMISFRPDGQLKHILSHQHLFVSFWIVQVKELHPQDGEVKVSLSALEDYPLPQLLIRYIAQSSLFGADSLYLF